MVVIAITGANVGVGYEVARQLAAVSEVTQIVITCRSAKKADAAISQLVQDTGKAKTFFEAVILDLGDLASIESAIGSFPSFDRLCLNAGGLGTGKMHASGNGMTDSMVINTMGHAALVDGLIANGKIRSGSRVVWVGSEVSRDVYSFSGLLPQYCGKFGEKDIDWAISKNYDGCQQCCGCPIQVQMGDYKNAKIIGHMHFVHLAKENPDTHFMTVSPGAIGGTFAYTAAFPVKQLMACMPCFFRVICVTHACSPAVSTQIGSKRITDVLTGDAMWASGSMPMSPKDCGGCCFWGGRGDMADNRPMVRFLADEVLCEKTAKKVREWNAKWASTPPQQMAMDKAPMAAWQPGSGDEGVADHDVEKTPQGASVSPEPHGST
eukprot:CAMPEP_0198515710 /NCGR_PEP_ID=MMETSP1462-20131121/17479_1 /TAXON_ID=1333877 /ORGANISM="Brandtodinium nutriculum, Strain RCC3387" /LENGTH=378 /DNA_ID=CAMNT_0044245215 /DNA_START=52 /DNA_END=1188 /DNA_ORIENTATION=+